MIDIKINDSQLAKLTAQLEGKAKRLPKEIAMVINATAKKVRGEINKEVRKELVTSKKAIDQSLKISRKATTSDLGSTVTMAKTKRIPLRDFGARQNKRGTSYRISKTEGRKLATSAFQGPTPGVMKASWRGRVFARTGKGRLPIRQLFGPSPWGVFVKRGLEKPTKKLAKAELKKQMDRRIRFLKLKSSGQI